MFVKVLPFEVVTVMSKFTPLNPSGYYMFHHLNIQKNSTFCPRSVFMCFVWI
jgi:hypothetical protein